MRLLLRGIALALAVLTPVAGIAADDVKFTPEQIEFFESKVRPLLVENCFECHSVGATKGVKGGLKLDSRAGLLKGGDSGPAVVVGKPDESLLVQAVRWQMFEMPPKGKLGEGQIELLARWVAQGAAWPEGDPAAEGTVPRTYNWAELRSNHWAWQPVLRPAIPNMQNTNWAKNPIDHFVWARLNAAGMSPAAQAEPKTLVRRVYFDLIGLPPAPEEVAAFTDAFTRDPDGAMAALVDRLLALPQYGERWARHWLDIARYSDLVTAQ